MLKVLQKTINTKKALHLRVYVKGNKYTVNGKVLWGTKNESSLLLL